MDFKNRVKGKITQSLLEALLSDVKYHIVSLGIEEVVREVTTLKQEQYLNLGLPTTLRSLPDFFVAVPELTKTWLVEVKYRKKWSEQVRDELGKKIIEQVKVWQPLHLVLFVGEPARQTMTPASHLGVCKLVVQDGELGILKNGWKRDMGEDVLIERFHPWGSVTWDTFSRFQDVFAGIQERYDQLTLLKAIEVMKGLTALELEEEEQVA